jgi:hypothetical protein
MTIALDEATQIITVDQSDLTFVSGDLYELDTNAFRLAIGALLDDARYIWMPPAFIHNGEVTVAGTTFSRTIELINGYSLTFEDLLYSVRLAGSNNNLFDVENSILNPSGNVTVIGQNSAGLVTVVTGSGLSAGQDTALTEIHRDRGLDAANAKVITENTADESYDEDVGGVTKEVRKVGSTTTITRL